MVKICIMLIIGIPGAGKTTFVKKLLQLLPMYGNFKLHTIIYDDMLGNDYYKDYKLKRQLPFETAKKLIEEIYQAKDDHLIVVDDNMYLKSMRYQYYKLARDYQMSFFQIHFDVPLATALERNATRNTPIPEHVIKRMSNKFESPCENWENILFEVLRKCMNDPVINITPTYEKPPIGVLQKIDVILRKIVHKNIKQNVSEASILCNRRIELFKSIKNGTISVDNNLEQYELEILLESLF
ncbi:hypothetical protein FQR65_LT07947 [Abscondita terminalis]|nr:hypothetical protein FQR65_LT07947 [Abscondita terminalis]